MSNKLLEDFVDQLISRSPKEKEKIGQNIVEMLGGDSCKMATGLPQRKGNQDGGIDGRISIYTLVEHKKHIVLPNSKEGILVDTQSTTEESLAGINIKIESNYFDREKLALFVNDLSREKLFYGIIISARSMSPDAECEYNRINREGKVLLRFLSLTMFLSNNFDLSPIIFKKNPQDNIINNREMFGMDS